MRLRLLATTAALVLPLGSCLTAEQNQQFLGAVSSGTNVLRQGAALFGLSKDPEPGAAEAGWAAASTPVPNGGAPVPVAGIPAAQSPYAGLPYPVAPGAATAPRASPVAAGSAWEPSPMLD